jgi:23S rRNA pseudouridine2605 synthase
VRTLLETVGSRVYPVGRLDFATSGALLATNDGELADGLMHPRRAVPKTYVLKVHGEMKPADVERWRKGVKLEDGMTLPADATLLRHEAGKTWLELTIREGRNQQIRRMGEATGFPVMRLARIAFAGITTEGLRPGSWRHLTRDELMRLKKEYGVPHHVPREPPARAPRRSVTIGPRYGGGAPVRRSLDVTEDWGGGSGRGRSARDGDVGQGDAPGRGGRTRTTGTSGGPRAGDGDDASWRISHTRRRSKID